MNEDTLRKKIGIGPKELINTNKGALDILDVRDNTVYYGFLAAGNVQKESVEDFLAHFIEG